MCNERWLRFMDMQSGGDADNDVGDKEGDCYGGPMGEEEKGGRRISLIM